MNRPKNKILKHSNIFRLAVPHRNQSVAFSSPFTVYFMTSPVVVRAKAWAMMSGILDGLNKLDFQIDTFRVFNTNRFCQLL